MGRLLTFIPKLAKVIARGVPTANRTLGKTKAGTFLSKGATKVRSALSGRLPKFIANTALWGGAGYAFDKFTEAGLVQIFGDKVDNDALNTALVRVRASLLEQKPVTCGAVYYLCDQAGLWEVLEVDDMVLIDQTEDELEPVSGRDEFSGLSRSLASGVTGSPAGSLRYYQSMIDKLIGDFQAGYRNLLSSVPNTALGRETRTARLWKFMITAVRLSAFTQLLMDDCQQLVECDTGEVFRVGSLVTTKAALAERHVIDDEATRLLLRQIVSAPKACERRDAEILQMYGKESPFDWVIYEHFPLISNGL